MPSSITLTVKQLPTSTSFFLSALQPLDYVYRGRVNNTIGFGLKDSPPDFWISQEAPGVPAGAAHVAFPATSQKKVQEFFVAALKAGGKCHGEPALRDQTSGYYSAAIIDFDGNSIEAVYRPDLVDEGYGSRPSSISSVGSLSPQAKMSSKAPTTVSKASTVKPKTVAATEVKSVAPSSASRAPTQVSKAQTATSKAPTQVSKTPTAAPSHVSRAPSAAPSQASRAPTNAPTQVSRAPTAAAPTQVSRAPTQSSQSPPPQPQPVTYTTPQGEVITNFVTQAQGAISIAKQLVNEVRPALEQSNSAPNIHTTNQTQRSDPNSHKPSDTIVGTLLGVAAGAALTYAYTKATEGDRRRDEEALAYGAPPPRIVRTNTEPPRSNEQLLYYSEYNGNQPYAIEAPPSEYGQSRAGSQRYITLQDNDERLSDYAPSQRPRRRSSFSGIDVRSFASASRASKNPASSARMLEGPPTSYRAPTAITQADSESRVSSRSKSRTGSSARAASETRSHHSRRSSGGSRAPSTVVPAKTTVSRATTVRPEDKSLPPSRAATSVSKSPTEYMSATSKANRTVIGKMLDRERTGGRSELTKSVVGKIEDSEKLNVSSKEVDPSDSVSQVSSVRSKRTSSKRGSS